MKDKKIITVAISGGFDPIHIGHARMMEDAKKLGDRLIVILNNDNWLNKKKGYAFMPENERAELIRHIRWVDEVVITSHAPGASDMSVAAELRMVKPDIFANGGDRKVGNTPEGDVCAELGIEMAFEVGRGCKVQSSSWLVGKLKDKA